MRSRVETISRTKGSESTVSRARSCTARGAEPVQVPEQARRQILVRLQEQGVQHVPFDGETFDLIPADFGQRAVIRQHSRARYARPRAAVEEKIARFFRAARRKSPP